MVCIVSAAAADSRFGESPRKIFLEMDQMFMLKIGAEQSLSPDWGIKFAAGVSAFGLTTFGYEVVGVYHLKPSENRFQLDLEFGLPVAYFNFLEGVIVDWDPNIEEPFAGWAPGADLVWGIRFNQGTVLCIKTGFLIPVEYQKHEGWSTGMQVIPAMALQCMI